MKNRPDGEGFLGRIGPKGIENIRSDEDGQKPDNDLGAHGNESAKGGDIPSFLLEAQIQFFLDRLKGQFITTGEIDHLAHQLKLFDEGLDDLRKRLRGTNEHDWQTKPKYFHAVLMAIRIKVSELRRKADGSPDIIKLD